MFAFFVNDVFSGFWANDLGDIFVELTCANKGWDKTQVKMYYYPTMNGKDVATSKIDGFNVRVMSSNEENATLVKLCEGDLFYSNGVMLIPC